MRTRGKDCRRRIALVCTSYRARVNIDSRERVFFLSLSLSLSFFSAYLGHWRCKRVTTGTGCVRRKWEKRPAMLEVTRDRPWFRSFFYFLRISSIKNKLEFCETHGRRLFAQRMNSLQGELPSLAINMLEKKNSQDIKILINFLPTNILAA